MVEGGGAILTSVPRRITIRGGGLTGGGTDHEWGMELPRHRLSGGDLECGGGDSQLPLHRHHHLPQLPPRITGGLRYRDRHPIAQADSSGCSLEG